MKDSDHDRLKEIEEKIKAKDYGENVFGVSDGVICFDEYTDKKTKYKILWILREPYESDKIKENINKEKVGGWSLASALNKRESWEQTVKSKGGVQTYRKLIQTTYAILNTDGNDGFKKNSYKKDFDYLKKVACINVKKMPGKSNSKDKVILQHYLRDTSQGGTGFLKQQIKLIDPDIIIYGGTFKYFKKNHFKEELPAPKKLNNTNSFLKKGNYYIIDGKLHIDTYHPSCRMKDECYSNNISRAVKKWENQI